jgi:hypothetical protein
MRCMRVPGIFLHRESGAACAAQLVHGAENHTVAPGALPVAGCLVSRVVCAYSRSARVLLSHVDTRASSSNNTDHPGQRARLQRVRVIYLVNMPALAEAHLIGGAHTTAQA